KEAQRHQDLALGNVRDLAEAIKAAAKVRNALCHASWHGSPSSDGGSTPFFVNRQMEIFDTRVDVEFLRGVREHVVELICAVIDSVTQMGWRFPGAGGPGAAIWHGD
ncbi:MAG TPA: hypothetical protein VGE01_03440, partial [Fimbriimonas sp.]